MKLNTHLESVQALINRLEADLTKQQNISADLQRRLDSKDASYRAMQSRYDKAHAQSAKLEKLVAESEPVARCQHDELQAMHYQLQELSSRLVALESDSANYHHLLSLMKVHSMVAGIKWIQARQVSTGVVGGLVDKPALRSDWKGNSNPACGSVIIGSAYDKDSNPRD